MDLTTSQPAMPSGTAPYVSGQGEDPTQHKDDPAEKLTKDIEKHFKSQVESCERTKKGYINKWKRNIDLRMGQPYGPYSSFLMDADDEYQSELNPDWYLTKAKTANLYSQTPKIQLIHENRQYEAAIGPFQKAINYELSPKRCDIGSAMFECAQDIVNAAGIGAYHVGFAARFEDREVPKVDTKLLPPMQVIAMMQLGTLPMEMVPYMTDYRFFTRRISPNDLLYPVSFTGSNFDDAPWIGERVKMSWAEAQQEWHLEDDEKDLYTSDDAEKPDGDLRVNRGEPSPSNLSPVRGKRIYYWRALVDPKCKLFSEIWEIVWLDRREAGAENKPVYHDRWKGQQFVPETGHYVGACRFPIRVCTLTYVTDNPIVPSDSEAGRPQVNDLRRSRSQMFQNRAYSLPVRWFNTDKTDPMMHDLLMKGRIQGMIPVQGDGTKMIGEVARASYPAEDHTFDQMANMDLLTTWGMGPNQLGQVAAHEITKGESENAAEGFNTVMGMERGRFVEFFLSGVEVLAGLMALYSDFPSLSQQDRMTMMQAWDRKHILHDLAFTILPGSQIVENPEQKIKRTAKLLNLTAKSGFANVKMLITDLFRLNGFDPAEYVVDPQPHPMKPASISYSFKGKEDLMNPMVVALLARNQQLPTPEELDTARNILMRLSMALPMKDQQPQPQMGPRGPQKMLPQGPNIRPGQDMMPGMSLANKVAKRSRDVGGV